MHVLLPESTSGLSEAVLLANTGVAADDDAGVHILT